MPTLDASSLAQAAIRLNLITEEQWQECWEELESNPSSPEAFIRLMERKAYLTPWQAAKLLREEKDGYFLGGYRLLYRIAAGSFGRVYRADNPRNGEIVAIKVLRRKWSNDTHRIELFEREGKVGMTMKHPNIVQILNVGRDAATGQHYIVMEFVEGGNLRDILSIRKRLDPAEALRILEECASGLAYASSRGLSHRDIKLSNILLSALGTAKLVDFGLAEIVGGASKEEDETCVDRTVDYAGLERATGCKSGDLRSDIYFLGCVFFEILTSRPLLTVTKDAKERMQKERYEVLRALHGNDVELPAPVLNLLQRMTAFWPADRIQTPAQLVDAVHQSQRELQGETNGDPTSLGPKTVFVVEHHPKLQDAFRDRFRELGYRVLISIDAARAVQRFKVQPFQVLIVDAGTAGEDGVKAFDLVLKEAERQKIQCGGILILSETQEEWRSRLKKRPNATVLVRPVTMKQITRILRQIAPIEEAPKKSSDNG